MATSMFDLFDKDFFQQMLDEKYIRVKLHPTLPLRIIEYTEKTVYDNYWNEVTKNCRGLIVDSYDNVVARPFSKFMNYNPETDGYLLDEEAVVLDKIDGSLGILYTYKHTTAIATKGSFTSDQAAHATSLWWNKYAFLDNPDRTYLFEIVYPENRIVVDYGDRDELILLGARDIATGREWLPNELSEWEGPTTTIFPYKSLREAVQSLPRPNAEGFVVYFPKTGHRLKFKYEDYLVLHKIISDLTPRRIWEAMKAGKSLEEILSPIPDEWHEWTKQSYEDIQVAFSKAYQEVVWEFYRICLELSSRNNPCYLDRDWTRKDFAEVAKKFHSPGLLFNLLDNKEVTPAVWDMVRP